jgi:anti-sigma factor RsiW
MVTHEQTSQLLVGFVLGELSEEQALDVKAHVAECKQCSQELKLLETPVKCAAQMSKLSFDERSCGAAVEAILAAVENEQKPVSRPAVSLEPIWRTIMKSRITKLAAAAVIVIALMLTMYFGDGKFELTASTFAQMTEAMKKMPPRLRQASRVCL